MKRRAEFNDDEHIDPDSATPTLSLTKARHFPTYASVRDDAFLRQQSSLVNLLGQHLFVHVSYG